MMQHKRLVKRKRGEDKDEQEGGTTFMITTTAAVREVCVVDGNRMQERAKSEDKGNREKWQAEDDRAKKKRNVNDEGYSKGEEEDAITPSSKKISCMKNQSKNL